MSQINVSFKNDQNQASSGDLVHRRIKNLKVLFLYPNLYMVNMMPPSIAVLSALLKQQGFEVALFDTTYYPWDHASAIVSAETSSLDSLPQGGGQFDFNLKKAEQLMVRPYNLEDRGVVPKETDMIEDFLILIDSFRPDLISVSVVEDTYPQALYLLNQIKDRKIPTLVGGVFPTFAPEIAIKSNAIDMVCVGEGEGALVELCERMATGRDYSDVQNLWVKDSNGGVKKNPQRALVDMDTLPMMDFEIFEENRIYRPMAGQVYRMIPIETHRGCPYTCAFCNSPSQVKLHRDSGVGEFFRKKSMEKIREELAYLIGRWDAEYIYFPADTFLAWSDQEIYSFVDMYSEFKLPFWCQTRPETITEEKIEALKSVGCHRMSLGVEHGNQKFRKEVVGRPVSNETMIESINIVGASIPATVNNITGFPLETRELAFDTVRLNRELKTDTMNCNIFMPYHGTPLRNLAVKLGLMDSTSLTCSLVGTSPLNMPQYPRSEIHGLSRCFSLYARLPESMWPTIREAESDTEEGNAIFRDLTEEYIAKYFNDGDATFS